MAIPIAVGAAVARAVAMVGARIKAARLSSLLSFKSSRTVDTKSFDYAVGRIMRDWKPPPDIKRVIVSELGAVLALTSNDTLCAGPKGAKLKAPSKAQTYLRKRYTWKNRKGSVQNKEAVPLVKFNGKKYFLGRFAKGASTRGGYRKVTQTMILNHLRKRKDRAVRVAGSSKAMWLHMYNEVKKETGVRPKTFPRSWKYQRDVWTALIWIRSSSKWKKATEAKNERVPKGDFVIKVYSEAHNSLNPGVKGSSAFQKRMIGREKYVGYALTKATVASLTKMVKKFPGMVISGTGAPPILAPPVIVP